MLLDERNAVRLVIRAGDDLLLVDADQMPTLEMPIKLHVNNSGRGPVELHS